MTATRQSSSHLVQQKSQQKRDFQAQFRESTDALRPGRTADKTTGFEQTDQAVQVEPPKVPSRIPAVHLKPLSVFLRSVEAGVTAQLERNLRSQAEKCFKVEWRNLGENATLISKFERKIFTDLPCIVAQWNCNGTLLATAFGRTDHDSFCFHKTGICVWRVFLGKPKAEPEHILNLDTCVSGIAFHPKKANLLAAAGANGEIFVWDLALSADNLIADSGLKTAGGHSEPMTALRWVTLTPSSRTYMLLTAGLDGKLIVWGNSASREKPNHSPIIPTRHMIVMQNPTSLLKSSWTDSGMSASIMGITAVNSVGTSGSTVHATCLIGTDTGAVGSCSFGDFKEIRSLLIDSAVTLQYEPHNGPVSGISRSPFSDQCFATVSSDGKLRLYRNTDTTAIIETAPFHGKLTCCDWSPFRPFVIAAGTAEGTLLFFDFQNSRQNRSKPAKTVGIFQDSAILSVQFNHQDCDIVAIGGTEGVQLWKIPEIFSTETDDEQQNFFAFLREHSS